MKFKNPFVLYTVLLNSIPLSPNSCPFPLCSHALKFGRLKTQILPKVIFRFLARTQIFSLFGTSTVGKVGKEGDVCREERREEYPCIPSLFKCFDSIKELLIANC